MSNINITSECYFHILSNIKINTYGGDFIDVIKKIDHLLKERGWSDYRLSAESGLSTSTIANMRRRNTVPSISTLETICQAFGITLSQFFQEENNLVELTSEQKEFFDNWVTLTASQKKLFFDLIKELKSP
ncbi:helix-turn-helix domain-containing protein [Roseburia intestinalis]|uniref:DNA-binding helix-turn-helix protein n=1 Tax=Roseburia intestinalis L1-82 TaxID=536231 RepID=C7GC90_9FIRM|nr:helix-turn-helix transcriptional regulator [Roseburia intestinalis]EEV00578.1 DNA-binding helix-turn-helix protein [Roseburia intestinalis L1-82]UWP57246.1 helix-turn-helix transcriptional regulator [Roseburia intestinalis]